MTMSTRQIVPAFRCLRRLLATPDAGSTSDAQLLQRFVSQRDELAFELLVWRHGPMVYGVCRRVLRDEHDAEDAFQATLLVLARKAGSIGKRESVGSWLYKVAYRVALRARDGALRRARHERQVLQMPAVDDPHSAGGPAWDELRPVLDEELNRLPEKHRAPVVLCYLEGLTNEEAARQLCCPVGTLKTRLAQARRLLGQQLSRRGLALAAGLVAAEGAAVGEAPPAALVGATVRAAALAAAGKVVVAGAVSAPVAILMEGALRAMMVTKLKGAVVLVALGLAIAGAGTASYRALAEDRSSADFVPPKATPAEVRVTQIKKQIAELTQELSRAEEAAARERAVPPQKRPVAIIFDDVRITREELADHLLARMTAKQYERYINRRILEHACKRAGIAVTNEEVGACLKAEWGKAGVYGQPFRDQVLRKQNMTLREWKEDVLRPQLMLKKLFEAGRIREKDLCNAFEARYGEKVECDVLVVSPQQRHVIDSIALRIRTGEASFEEEAKRCNLHRDRPIVITRHWRKHEGMEKAAFALRPGEVSRVIAMPGAFVILKCRRRAPADRSVKFEDVRESLKLEVAKRLPQNTMADHFRDLKAKARARLLWAPLEDKEAINSPSSGAAP
jgi:RNA polymerase sigma factor (sigma-70 family)